MQDRGVGLGRNRNGRAQQRSCEPGRWKKVRLPVGLHRHHVGIGGGTLSVDVRSARCRCPIPVDRARGGSGPSASSPTSPDRLDRKRRPQPPQVDRGIGAVAAALAFLRTIPAIVFLLGPVHRSACCGRRTRSRRRQSPASPSLVPVAASPLLASSHAQAFSASSVIWRSSARSSVGLIFRVLRPA